MRNPSPMRKNTLALFLSTLSLLGCAPQPINEEEAAHAVEGYIEDVEKLAVVDCLLPGQVRKLGQQVTYLSARRPIRTTAADCEVRGGEYTAYDRANYSSALKVWLPKAEQGDASAQLYVGEIYEKGLGQPANHQEAAKWYRKAAEQGNAQAQINLGAMYEKGLGVSKNPAAAAEWYRKASGLESAGIQFAPAVAAADIAERQAELENLRSSVAQSRAETEQLRTQLGAAQKASGVDRQTQAELEAMRRKLEQKETESQQLRAQLAASKPPTAADSQTQAELEALRRQLEQKDAESRQLRDQLSTAKQSSDADRQAELEALRQKAERSEAEARQLRTQLGSARQSAEAEHKTQAELEALRKKAERSEAEAQELRTRLSSARQPSAADRQTQAELEALRSKVEQSQAETERLRAALGEAQARFMEQQDALRESQDELEKLREQLAREKDKSADSVDDTRIRQLEAALRDKQELLKAQQAKVNRMASSFEQERRKLNKELAAAKTVPSAPQATAAAQTAPARGTLDEAESSLQARMEEYRKGSSELTAWLTQQGANPELRGKIDQRKRELQQQAAQIAELKQKVERLATQAKQAPLQLAQAGPEIEILSPPINVTRGVRTIQIGAGAKELVGKIQAPDGLLSLLVNDRPLTPDASGVFHYPLASVDSSKPITIKATDKQNKTSGLDLSLITAGAGVAETPPSAAPASAQIEKRGDVRFGKFYAIIIGNNDYVGYDDLQTPINDAKSLDVVLRERYGFTTKLLVNANRHQIMTALNEIHRRLTADDNLLIYYAGHGEIDQGSQQAYWLPVDAEKGNPANWISSQSITEFLSIMPARHIMVVADSCYAGALAGSAVAKLPEGMDQSKREKWLKVMASRKARTVLTSGGVGPVLDQGGSGHSVFANAFLSVLRSNQRVLEDYDVFRAVAGPVKASASKAGFQQAPQYAPLQHAGHEGSPFFFVPESV